jgi:hypothetical protein
MNQKQQGLQPAFPAFPLQDQFGKFISPFPGMSKFEFIALNLLKQKKEINPEEIADTFIDALNFMEIFETFVNELDEEQKTKLQLI